MPSWAWAVPRPNHPTLREPSPFSISPAFSVLSSPLPLFLEPNVTISIANRILLGFAVIVALMIGLGMYALSQLDDVRQTTETIVSRDLSIMRNLEKVRDHQNQMRALREEALSRYFLRSLGQQQTGLEDTVNAWTRQAATTEAAIIEASANLNNLRGTAVNSQRADSWRRISELLTSANADFQQIRGASERQLGAIQANDLPTVLASENALDASRASWVRNLDEANKVLDDAIVLGQQRVGLVYDQ